MTARFAPSVTCLSNQTKMFVLLETVLLLSTPAGAFCTVITFPEAVMPACAGAAGSSHTASAATVARTVVRTDIPNGHGSDERDSMGTGSVEDGRSAKRRCLLVGMSSPTT